MATLTLKSITTLVSNQAAAVQASATALIDFSVGSVLRAVAEANAAVGVWLQGLVLTVLQVSRLSTSTGSDVDSFVNDYGIYRLGSSNANGSVTFSRYTNTQSAVVPVGAQVQSADGTQTFTVVVDATNPSYSASLNGFLIPAGVTSITCLVSSTTAGPAANVVAGGVNRIATSISGVDYVSNLLALVGGAIGETDAALKVRFVLFFLGLSRGNVYGVEYALASMNVSIQYTITDCYSYGGVFTPGFFYVVVDDGSGSPSSKFLSDASTAVASVRPFGVQFAVFAPVFFTVNASCIIAVASGYDHDTVASQVGASISAAITALGLGAGLPYGKLYEWAFSVPGVSDVTAVLINGSTADIPANNNKRIVPGTVAVS